MSGLIFAGATSTISDSGIFPLIVHGFKYLGLQNFFCRFEHQYFPHLPYTMSALNIVHAIWTSIDICSLRENWDFRLTELILWLDSMFVSVVFFRVAFDFVQDILLVKFKMPDVFDAMEQNDRFATKSVLLTWKQIVSWYTDDTIYRILCSYL